MGISVKDVNEESQPDSPYIAARREWHERYGSLISQARNWRRIAFCCVLITLLSLSMNGVQLLTGGTYYVPYLVDRLGNTVAANLTAMSAAEKADASSVTIQRFLEDVRTVTTDGVEQKHKVDRAYKFIAPTSNANTIIDDFYRTNKPEVIARTNTVDVEVRSVGLQSDSKTYQVDWTENTRDLLGSITKSEDWRGWLVVTKAIPADANALKANPFGLFVEAVSWTRVQNNKEK